MQTTNLEYDINIIPSIHDIDDKEKVIAYSSLLAVVDIQKGDERDHKAIITAYKLIYTDVAKNEELTSFELWLEDANKLYSDLYQEYTELLKKQETAKISDHFNHKIPLDIYDANKSDFDDGIVEMLANEGNLLIRGESDTGKSHLAVAVLREYVDKKPKMKIEMFFEDDFHELTYDESQREAKRLKRLDGVIFDDLGAIGLGIDKRNLIKGVIYSNFRNNKLCIICTNCEVSDLYDERTGSKIVGACTIVNKKDTGTRKKNKKEIAI